MTLDNNKLDELVSLLLECSTVKSRAIREKIVLRLPSQIAGRVNLEGNALADVDEMAGKCNDFSGGLTALIEAVRFFEGTTLQMQAVDAFLGELSQNNEQLESQSGVTAKLLQFTTWSFDMWALVDICLEELYQKQGLVGLAIPDDTEAFRSNFSRRLEVEFKALSPAPLRVMPTFSFKSAYTTTDYAVKTLKKSAGLLQKLNVLYPIVIQCSDTATADKFWEAISAAFPPNFNNLLVAVMFGPPGTTFPSTIKMLEPPVIIKTHALKWVGEVVQTLGWPYDVKTKWTEKLLTSCASDGNTLQLEWVYQHLEIAIQTIQQLNTEKRLKPDCFLAELNNFC